MTILDSNVLSETVREVPSPVVVEWIWTLDPAETFTTAITQAELLYGVERLALGRRREGLSAAIERLLVRFAGRILPFDEEAARWYAKIVAGREALGRPIKPPDAMIAAIARSQGATVATRDSDDFASCGIHVVNPWGE